MDSGANMKRNKQSLPLSRSRMKLPNNDRLTYKLFFEEKRLEIFQSRAKKYDESLSAKPESEPVDSLISLPKLNNEVDEMWEELSSQDRNKFKFRAIMMDVKRQRTEKEEGSLELSPSAKFVELPSFNVPLSVDVAFSKSEDMCDDLIARSVDSSSSNLGITSEQRSAEKHNEVKLLQRQFCEEPSMEHSTRELFQGHSLGNEILPVTGAYEDTQMFSQYPSNNLSSSYLGQFSTPMALTPASCDYSHPIPHMYTSSKGYYAPAFMHTSPIGYCATPGNYCAPQSTYCSLSHLTCTQRPYYLFVKIVNRQIL